MKASYSLSHNHTRITHAYKAYTPRSPPYKKKSEVSIHILKILRVLYTTLSTVQWAAPT